MSIDLLTFRTKDLTITILPGPFYEFISEIKERLCYEDPLQYSYSMIFKKHFIELIAEVQHIYMEEGSLVHDIKEMYRVFNDYVFYIDSMIKFLRKEMISGGF